MSGFNQAPITLAAAAFSDLPVQMIPPGLIMATSDDILVCPVYIDELTPPDRMVVVSIKTTGQIGFMTFTLVNGQWMFDSNADIEQLTRNLTDTAAGQPQLNAFAIRNPGTSQQDVLFISFNDATANPDDFLIDSIAIPIGGVAGVAVACTLAGPSIPGPINNIGACTIPLRGTEILSVVRDDGYFATISGDETGFTMTYHTVRSNIGSMFVENTITQEYSGWRIGDSIAMLKAPNTVANSGGLWVFDIQGNHVVTHDPYRAAGMGSYQDTSIDQFSRITRVGGQWAIASPKGGGDPGTLSAFDVTPINLEGF